MTITRRLILTSMKSFEIEPKIASAIQKLYALAFPRWTLHFIDGLLLAAIGWASRMKNGKIKVRQVNDPSFHMNSNKDTGAANDQISLDKGPFVYHQSAFQRALERAYNLRISHPLDDIITSKNDLLTAFRRLRYNPDSSCLSIRSKRLPRNTLTSIRDKSLRITTFLFFRSPNT